MNKIILHGKLTRDPELKTVSGGIECCKFTLAVDRQTRKDAERITDFIPCTAWRQSAALVAKYMHKGDGMIVEGALHLRSYEKDGEKRTAFDIDVDRVEFAEKANRNGTTYPVQSNQNVFEEVEDGELPF